MYANFNILLLLEHENFMTHNIKIMLATIPLFCNRTT